MSDSNVTIVGNVTRDPEIRFTSSGNGVAKFGVAVNFRKQNRQTGNWDEETSFFDVVAFSRLAENVGESIAKGDRVVVSGRLTQRSYETNQGDKRSAVEVVADEIGPSLRWATAKVTRNPRDTDNNGGGRNGADRQPAPATVGSDEEPF